MVFMTDDAVPADERLIEHLTAAFDQRGPGGESVIMAYARQLPDKDCAMAERFTRSFNYPEDSCIKTKEDLGKMGIKTFLPPMYAVPMTGRSSGSRAVLSIRPYSMRI